MGWRFFFSSVVLANLISCSPNSPTQPQSQLQPPLATVAGHPVSAELFNYYVGKKSGQRPDQVDAGLKNRLFEELVALEATAAAGAAVTKPDAAQEIELGRLETLSKIAADDAGINVPPSDQELRTAYESFIKSLPANEYHVAHILLATEALAVRVILDLDQGSHFADLAKQRSADDSKERGGDLGWISSGHLPKNFMDAVGDLKAGEYTRHPIQTTYGWHVIKLIESRPAPTPPFDQVKAQVAVNLQQERRAKFIQTTLAKTKIEQQTHEASATKTVE